MTERMSYRDQLRHPNWQKKRLEVLESAGFVCQICGSGDKMLHVHHRRYIKGRMAWDYSNGNFDVLCEVCHKDAHDQRSRFDSIVALLDPGTVQMATALLAGWLSDGFDIGIDKGELDQDAFHAGRLASYMCNFESPSLVADQLCKTSPAIVQEFLDQAWGRK